MAFVPSVTPSPVQEMGKEQSPAGQPALVDIESELKAMWERMLQVGNIDPDADFFELNGHSLIVAQIFVQIQQRFKVDLGLAVLFEARTLRSLARRIQAAMLKPSSSSLVRIDCIVPIRSKGTRLPFFCVHGMGGNLLNYEALMRLLPESQPVYGIQAVGLDGGDPDTTIPEMATRYIKDMRRVQPEGPYFLGGHSFGGLVAYEMAYQLQASGVSVGAVVLMDTFQLNSVAGTFWSAFMMRTAWRYNRLRDHARNLARGPDRVGYIKARLMAILRRVDQGRYRLAHALRQKGGSDLPTQLRVVEKANWMACASYVPRPSSLSATLFRCTTRSLGDHLDYLMGWRHIVLGGITVFEVPGAHLSMLENPHVEALAQKIDQTLSNSAAQPGGIQDLQNAV
jgi:thioesterase domain-containing protein/acyl carrier protein